MPTAVRTLTLALAVVACLQGCKSSDPFGCDDREPLVLDHVALPDATVGTRYEQPVPLTREGQAHGAIASLTRHAGSPLPPGLALDATERRITGTPTAAGEYTFQLDAAEYGTQCSGRGTTFQVSLAVRD